MRVSVSSMFLWDLDPRGIADVISGARLDGVELWVETPWYWEGGRRKEQAEEMKRELDGLAKTVHAPVMDLNPASYNDRVCRATMEETLRAIDLAGFLGADLVTIHPGRRTAKRPVREVEREKLRRYLRACLDRAVEGGILLALENLEPLPWNICADVEEMGRFLDDFPLGMTLDISHAIPPLSRGIAFAETFAERILNVHVSTTREGTRHHPISDGSADDVLAALRKIGYDGPLTLELDDNKFAGTLSKEDKVGVLIGERRHLESVWG
ncbi:sugar phosphate isomerase/epimerase family protein [Candidatus Methanocrinis natronophilus]|uniref:Sugar phosphate isomerase/epimerase n=1 Tax=Candidatus Methanocrinis natronophilus TaxID=3033396 RepID=A0ABT5X670_9EURY|nr:sugar phosphate isomerase/epimerase family protein [Candidatus Methanocrinis natronophilus]MDF0590182.1 sugar phosphate isomerase/epimerase [Candidatus Methanocrinis natronophilus]